MSESITYKQWKFISGLYGNLECKAVKTEDKQTIEMALEYINLIIDNQKETLYSEMPKLYELLKLLTIPTNLQINNSSSTPVYPNSKYSKKMNQRKSRRKVKLRQKRCELSAIETVPSIDCLEDMNINIDSLKNITGELSERVKIIHKSPADSKNKKGLDTDVIETKHPSDVTKSTEQCLSGEKQLCNEDMSKLGSVIVLKRPSASNLSDEGFSELEFNDDSDKCGSLSKSIEIARSLDCTEPNSDSDGGTELLKIIDIKLDEFNTFVHENKMIRNPYSLLQGTLTPVAEETSQQLGSSDGDKDGFKYLTNLEIHKTSKPFNSPIVRDSFSNEMPNLHDAFTNSLTTWGPRSCPSTFIDEQSCFNLPLLPTCTFQSATQLSMTVHKNSRARMVSRLDSGNYSEVTTGLPSPSDSHLCSSNGIDYFMNSPPGYSAITSPFLPVVSSSAESIPPVPVISSSSVNVIDRTTMNCIPGNENVYYSNSANGFNSMSRQYSDNIGNNSHILRRSVEKHLPSNDSIFNNYKNSPWQSDDLTGFSSTGINFRKHAQPLSERSYNQRGKSSTPLMHNSDWPRMRAQSLGESGSGPHQRTPLHMIDNVRLWNSSGESIKSPKQGSRHFFRTKRQLHSFSGQPAFPLLKGSARSQQNMDGNKSFPKTILMELTSNNCNNLQESDFPSNDEPLLDTEDVESNKSKDEKTCPIIDKSQRACCFYMRGGCKKEDCEYAHDLSIVRCKFWEKGDCFKADTCPFRHLSRDQASD